MAGRALHGLVGFVLGLVAGVVVTLGVVVTRARLEEVYLHGFGELVGWISLPVLVFPVLGAFLAFSEGHRLAPAALASLVGLVGGAALGVLAGSLLSDDPAWPWAGGTMGAAAGLLVAFLLRAGRSLIAGERRDARTSMVVAALLAVALARCDGGAPPLPGAVASTEPDPADVESVVYLLGDPGEAVAESYPVLPALRQDVETWAGRLGGRGRVLVLFLGDIVYPNGMADREAESFDLDSARVSDQVAVLAGPAARAHGVRGFFTAGNHDWGQEEDWKGAVRVVRLADFLRRRRAEGVDVTFVPQPGTGGPEVVDVGEHLRLILLDTAWWLYDAEAPAKETLFLDLARALGAAGDRRTVIAAHHPFRSGGPHGDLLALDATLGLRTLLSRSGAILQDLRSEPYRELRQGLERIFRQNGAPDVFAGGHEHSLQVIRGVRDEEPTLSLVSGSASKLTDVAPVPGTVFAASAPGYMRLFVLRDGTLRVRVEAAPPDALVCPGDGPERARCMEAGQAAYHTVWAGSGDR